VGRDWFADTDQSEEAKAWHAEQKRYRDQADARVLLHAPYTELFIWEEFNRYMTRLSVREGGVYFVLKGPHRTNIRFRRGQVIGGWWNASVVVKGWVWVPERYKGLIPHQGRIQRLWFNPETGHWRTDR
jgi:hypothetical protein